MHRIIARAKVELIVLFGYSVGLLLLAGFFIQDDYLLINPGGKAFWESKIFIETAVPDLYIRTTLALFLLILLCLSVKKAYAIGGPAGIIAVAMGFLAGLATPTDLLVGPAMLLLAAISAYISVTGWRTLKPPQG
jgi:hypothetical protein